MQKVRLYNRRKFDKMFMNYYKTRMFCYYLHEQIEHNNADSI